MESQLDSLMFTCGSAFLFFFGFVGSISIKKEFILKDFSKFSGFNNVISRLPLSYFMSHVMKTNESYWIGPSTIPSTSSRYC